MKQSEKLDLILRFLYDKKFDGNYYNLLSVLLDSGINSNLNEAFALGKRLERDGLVEGIGTWEGGMDVCLTTEGIDYIENDSYTNKGHSIINNHYSISISDSTNTNVVQNSSNVSIAQNNNQVDDLIQRILVQLQGDKIETSKFEEIKDCLDEIKQSLIKDIKPKFSFRSLLTMTSEFSSICSLVITLGQTFGLY